MDDHFIRNYIREYTMAQQKHNEEICKPPQRWKTPTLGCVKVNFDGDFIEKAKMMLSMFNSICFTHIGREGNKVANNLAVYGLNVEGDYMG